jgi:hypothetical protein
MVIIRSKLASTSEPRHADARTGIASEREKEGNRHGKEDRSAEQRYSNYPPSFTRFQVLTELREALNDCGADHADAGVARKSRCGLACGWVGKEKGAGVRGAGGWEGEGERRGAGGLRAREADAGVARQSRRSLACEQVGRERGERE